MLTMKQVHYITGKAETTLRRYFANMEFEPYIIQYGKRIAYREEIIEFLKTYKPPKKVPENRGRKKTVRKQHVQKNYEYENNACKSLCWKCRKSDRSGCSWAEAFIPVKGWKAKEVKLKEYRKPSLPPPVIVMECPEFEKEEKKK